MGAENELEVGQLLEKMVSSFTSAASTLHTAMNDPQWADKPYVYHMPKMSLAIKLELSFSDKKIKGFFKKSATEKSSGLMSTIELDVVSVPRQGGGEG